VIGYRKFGTSLHSQEKSTNWSRKSNDIPLKVVGISLTKRCDSDTAELQDGWKLFCYGDELASFAQAGVGMLVSP